MVDFDCYFGTSLSVFSHVASLSDVDPRVIFDNKNDSYTAKPASGVFLID